MAPRSRRKASSPVIEPADLEETTTAHTSLKFKQQLIGRPGKPIPVAELLKRLKALHAELVGLDEENCSREEIIGIGRELIHTNVLGHKDKGVKAWAACCINEVFRCMVPDAPYTTSQLKDFFEYVINSVIPAFGDPADTYNELHSRIITSMTELKSIVLLCDLPSAESHTVRIFSNVFDVIADSQREDGTETPTKLVQQQLTDLLSVLIDEADTLSVEVVELILAQFLRTNSGLGALSRQGSRGRDLNTREIPPAYYMAKMLCDRNSERMSRAISQYFSTIVVDASDSAMSTKTKLPSKKRRRDDDSDEEEDSTQGGPSVQDMKELAKAHKLLRELWRSCPECIQNVIPQLEAELAAENADIRVLAVETTGDLVSGIGAAGLPEAEPLDPVAYPSHSLTSSQRQPKQFDILMAPAAPHDFGSTYPAAFSSFLNRKNDKAAGVRSAFASAIGRILLTSAGGIGLDRDELEKMLKCLADLLQDSDERVRLASVRAIAAFGYEDIVKIIGQGGGADEESSVLHHLVAKIRDKKPAVRTEAMSLASKLWGVASGAISEGDEQAQSLFGAIPGKIFETFYANDKELSLLTHRALFENLLPLQYPPIKDKGADKANGNSQRVKDSQASQASSTPKLDPDAIRAERILALAKDLEPRAKGVFFLTQKSQVKFGQYMELFLKHCEEWNGGVTKNSEGPNSKGRLGKVIDGLASRFPDPMTASDHLWKFAKKHDRRAYHLIRFTFRPDSDYKKVVNAIKEIKKRFEEAAGNASSTLTTLLPMIHQSSLLIYNRSHVPTVLKFSRKEESDLSSIAHEILREISEHHPEVFKAHVQTMCTSLIEHVPKPASQLDDGTVQTLKACAGFAQKYPSEMPQDRALLESMVQYALHGNPPEAAKHAVSIIISNEAKRDMYVKEVVSKCTKDFSLDVEGYLPRLAALSQVMLLAAPELAEDEVDLITTIAIKGVLMVASPETVDEDGPEWRDDLDDDTASKIWALKILVNRQRSHAALTSGADAEKMIQETGQPVFTLLQKILFQNGQLGDQAPPPHQKARLRVTAGQLLLKLCSSGKQLDHLLDATGFNTLALLAQDPLTQVRSAFVGSLKKYLGQTRLPARFHAMPFLLAFEPTASVKESTLTWLRARAAASNKANDHPAIEYALARLLSLLAHHPDLSDPPEPAHQAEFAHYILFYLRAVATEKNLPLIYHVAGRCKTVRDGIAPRDDEEAASQRLWCLADLAMAACREFADVQGWQLGAWSGDKVPMPAGIFAAMTGHAKAREVAERNWADEEVLEGLNEVVRAVVKGGNRKRKAAAAAGAEGANGSSAKKRRVRQTAEKAPLASARKAKKVVKKTTSRKDEQEEEGGTAERRRSARGVGGRSYKGMDDSEEEEGEEEEEEQEEDGGEDQEDGDVDEVEAPAVATPKSNPARKKLPAKTKAAATSWGRATRSRKAVVEIPDEDEDMDDVEDDDEEEV